MAQRAPVRLLATLVALVLGAAASCGDLPPYGQVLIVVDTDLPAPAIGSMLRVDLYSEDGRWIESSEFVRANADDWPASFTLYSADEEIERRVLVRLRVYAAGHLRDYLGERFAERPTVVDPFVAHTPAELCADPPQLTLGKSRVVRRGRDPLFDMLDGDACTGRPNEVGSAAAYFDVTTAGVYRVGRVGVPPFYLVDHPADLTLQVRRACDDPVPVACFADEALNAATPLLELALEPGRYHVVTGGSRVFPGDVASADVELAVAEASRWSEVTRGDALDTPIGTGLPRLLAGTEDVTPPSEPRPDTSVDRLLLVRIAPDTLGAVRVTLHGACAGTMARIGAALSPDVPSIADAVTCIDEPGQQLAVTEATIVSDRTHGASLAGSFLNEPCPPVDDDDPVACVPGGAFLFGRDTEFELAPERIAGVRRFWMDKLLVTQKRWKEAVAEGFVPDPDDGPIPVGENDLDICASYPDEPAHDGVALRCADWAGARAFCRFRGGDLPTEAQWEYVATAVGRPVDTRFAWGDDPPQCTCDGVDPPCHAPLAYRVYTCNEPGTTRDAVDYDEPFGDVVPGLGIVNFLQSQWTRDAYQSFTSLCWRGATPLAMECIQEEAPANVERSLLELPGRFFRSSYAGGVQFRCVYPEAP